MKRLNMHAELLFMPVEIEDIFFSDVLIKFSPTENKAEIITEKDIAFSSFVAILSEKEKRMQVTVKFFTITSDNPVNFSISCVGIYQWLGEELEEQAIKSIYSWGVSIQTSIVRQKIAHELFNSPYHKKLYLPLSLVKIENEEEE